MYFTSGRPRLVLVHPAESLDRLTDLGYGSKEYLCQGFTLANPWFINRYFKEELYVFVPFRIREIADEYIACFKRERDLTARFVVHIGGVGAGHALQNVKRRIGNVDVLGDAPVVNECSTGEQQAMLIDVVETMQSPE